MKKITIFKAKVKSQKEPIHVGMSKNICLMCGKEDIPEGTEVCYQCEKKYSEKSN